MKDGDVLKETKIRQEQCLGKKGERLRRRRVPAKTEIQTDETFQTFWPVSSSHLLLPRFQVSVKI